MISIRPPTSKSFSTFNNPLVTVPKVPITIGIIVTFMFHSFFQFSSKVDVFILLIFFQFFSVVSRDSKVDNFANSLFFSLWIYNNHQRKKKRICKIVIITIINCTHTHTHIYIYIYIYRERERERKKDRQRFEHF